MHEMQLKNAFFVSGLCTGAPFGLSSLTSPPKTSK